MSDKTAFGKIWIAGNAIRLISRRFYLPKTFYFLAKVFSLAALGVLRLIHALGLFSSQQKAMLDRLLTDPFRYKKMHYLMLDFLTAPFYTKLPDETYDTIFRKAGFAIKDVRYCSQEVFYLTERA